MIIDASTLTVNNEAFGQYIVECKFGYHKIWSGDSGRNLAGTMSGTLKGVFPKLTMQFRKLTKAELEIVAPILDSSTQTIVYYDVNKKENTTITTYTGDWELVNKNILQNEGFSCSFISTSKRV